MSQDQQQQPSTGQQQQQHRRRTSFGNQINAQLRNHPSQHNPYQGVEQVPVMHNSPPSHVYPVNVPNGSPSNLSNSFTGSPDAKGRRVPGAEAKVLHSFSPKSEQAVATKTPEQNTVRVLLLENVNDAGVNILKDQGYVVDQEKGSLGEDELIARLQSGNYQVLGIRSKTNVTAKVIEAAKSLLVIGCFCIGTNQVDLIACARAGIAVFNSPFSNSRSVAELVISEIIALSRQLVDRANEMRYSEWNKVSKGCYEVRGKTLGIIGYGHIGSQLSVLAEAMGMDVSYYDILPIMPLGSATQVDTLEELLKNSDFITLHVPELPETINMIGAREFAMMKKGAYFINNARGKVVDLHALADAMESGQVAGAAVDVYPKEPAKNGKYFDQNLNDFAPKLCKQKNVILTPHIGGSTEEAQRAIGVEVGSALVRYVNFGGTLGSVNFPEVTLKPIIAEGIIRVCYVHLNKPGVLRSVNAILGDYNVERQLSDSKGDIAYLMADISEVGAEGVRNVYNEISSLANGVATRVLF